MNFVNQNRILHDPVQPSFKILLQIRNNFSLSWNASDVSLGSSSIVHTSVLLRHLFPSTFKPSDSSRVTSSPSLDLDQSCQAGEQAKLNSVGGVFLGSSSILHTSVYCWDTRFLLHSNLQMLQDKHHSFYSFNIDQRMYFLPSWSLLIGLTS